MNREHRSILYIWLPCQKIYPVGPTYLAAYIHRKRPHIRQRILDLSTIQRRERLRAILDMVEAFKPEVIAFSWRDIQIYAPHGGDPSLELAFDFYYSRDMLRRVKAGLKGLRMVFTYENGIREKLHLLQKTIKAFPDKTITLGGGALSVFSREIIERLPHGVIGVIGEGEEALLAIADGRDLKGHRVIYLENGAVLSGTPANPVPAGDIHIDYNYITSIFPEAVSYFGETIGVQTKRGCPYHCEFCLYPYIEGDHVRYRDPEAILGEIDYLYTHWNTRKIWFADAQFIPGSASIPHCTTLLEGLVRRGRPVEWGGYVRTSLITPALARLMVASGVGDLEISITSGSQKVLNEMGMGFRLDHLYEGCRCLKKEGYQGKVTLNYSMNAPGETEETLLESIHSYKVIADIMGKGQVQPVIFFIGVQPHTRIEERLIESGYLDKIYNPLSLNPFSIRKLLYNPPPLDRMIAASCLEAWGEKEAERGERVMLALEKRLRGG